MMATIKVCENSTLNYSYPGANESLLVPYCCCCSSSLFPLGARAGTNNNTMTTGPGALDRNECIASLLKDCNERVLIFANSASKAETLFQTVQSLGRNSARVARYYSGVSMIDKDNALDMFRDQDCTEPIIMICTDAASRGLDLPRVDHVIMAECATSAVDFLHRVGQSVGRGPSFCSRSLSTAHFLKAHAREPSTSTTTCNPQLAIKQGGQRERDRPEESAFCLERTMSFW